jgi:hypothetical protein
MAVLVDKSAQDVNAFDPLNLRQVGWRRLSLGGGHSKVDAPMGAGAVVMLHVDGENLFELPPVPD